MTWKKRESSFALNHPREGKHPKFFLLRSSKTCCLQETFNLSFRLSKRSLFGLEECAGYLVSGSSDNAVCVWDPEKLSPALTLHQSHTHQVRSLSKVDQWTIASGSYDKTVSLWDLRTSRTAQNIAVPDMVYAVHVEGGRFVFTGESSGSFHVSHFSCRPMQLKFCRFGTFALHLYHFVRPWRATLKLCTTLSSKRAEYSLVPEIRPLFAGSNLQMKYLGAIK